MGRFKRGDVILASVRIDLVSEIKVRPCVVISICGNNSLIVCPVSSRPPSDAQSIPLILDDFSSGGLDLFDESYLLTSRMYRILSREVIGKKGHLSDEFIATHLPETSFPGK